MVGMNTNKILAVLIFILLTSVAVASGSPGPRNMNTLQLTAQAFKVERNPISSGKAIEQLFTTRKKLVYFLEWDPSRPKLQLNRSGGRPRLNLC